MVLTYRDGVYEWVNDSFKNFFFSLVLLLYSCDMVLGILRNVYCFVIDPSGCRFSLF